MRKRVFRCAFTIGNRRCTAAGTMSHRPAKGDWYCRTHFLDKKGGPAGLALMDTIDDERRRTVQDSRTPGQKAINAWIKKHPEVLRRPEDNRFSHLSRCIDAIPSDFFGQKQRLARITEGDALEYRLREDLLELTGEKS